ncbi:MAG: alkaline phosphatase family protein [Rikenellaceae bacterium]|nr:alkaline phosphatase family protein [Rikenellaceae bacterium]
MKNFYKLVIFSLLLWGALPLGAAEPVEPRLVVNIIIDGLRNDYISRFESNIGKTGIKRLQNGGTTFRSASYDFAQTNASAGLATIVTGANPSSHGVISSSWKDFTTNETVRIEEDKKFDGLGSDDENRGRVSALKLMVSTIGDQLKRYRPNSRSLSIAVNPSNAVIAGGRLADAAYWFDTLKGKWLTSSYYMERVPEWFKNYNNSTSYGTYSGQVWATLLDSKRYISNRQTVIQSDSSSKSFISQLFAQRQSRDFAEVMATPFGTEMIFDLVKKTVIFEDLGRDNVPDMLTVVVEPFGRIAQKYGADSRELEDALYRLDVAIGDLLSFLDIQVGEGKVLVMMTSSRGMSDRVVEDDKSLSGYFNTLQFKAIINGFLSAQLGPGEWVTYYNDRQLYLNRREIYAKGLKLADVQNMAAGFAIQCRGVANAVTATALQNSGFPNGVMRKIQNSYFPRTSGDLVINLLPGWIDDTDGVVADSGSAFRYDTNVPMIWYGWQIGTGVTVTREVDMCDVAATLAAILKIPIPESATGNAIKEIIEF